MGPGGNYSEHPLPLEKLWILHFCSQVSPNLSFPNLQGVAHLQDLSARITGHFSSADGLRVSTCSSLVQWDFVRIPGGLWKFYSCRKWGPVEGRVEGPQGSCSSMVKRGCSRAEEQDAGRAEDPQDQVLWV